MSWWKIILWVLASGAGVILLLVLAYMVAKFATAGYYCARRREIRDAFRRVGEAEKKQRTKEEHE